MFYSTKVIEITRNIDYDNLTYSGNLIDSTKIIGLKSFTDNDMLVHHHRFVDRGSHIYDLNKSNFPNFC